MPLWTRIAALVLAPAASAAAQPQPPTFADVAPLIWRHCAPCHRPGQSAPFSLVTFEDVRPHAQAIVRAVTTRAMPPWMPESTGIALAGERRLTSAEIALVQRWAAAGFRRGDRSLESAPIWNSDWQLGKPDLVVTMPEPYELAPGSRDLFRSFVMEIPGSDRRYVRAWEFRAEPAGIVHHANVKVDRTRSSRRLDDEEPGPGYAGGASRHAEFPDGHFLGWTPGQSPQAAPSAMSWQLEAGSDLVVEAHLMPSAQSERVRLSVALYLTDQPPVQMPYTLRLSRQDIDIPAGERVTLSDSFVLPVDVDVLSVQPHAHRLATQMVAEAVLPDGTSRQLISIKRWNFGWQDNYRLESPLRLPRGSTLSMRFAYDNSAANRQNPNRPPQRVTFGQTTASEMASLWVQVLPHDPDDRRILDAQFSAKLLRDDITGYRKMLEVAPRDPRVHAALAHALVENGDRAGAVEHFRTAVEIDPTFSNHYELGSVLLAGQQWAEAAVQFERACALRPSLAEAAFGLGVARQQQKRPADAIEAYQRALSLGFRESAVHANLARAFVETARIPSAVAEFRRALELEPQDVGLLIDLAWLLATAEQPDVRDPVSALTLAERASALTNRRNALVLDTLAVAAAAAGHLEQGIAAAREAEAVARESGLHDLADRIHRRLEAFVRGR